MIRLFANANYDFIRWRRWAYGLTALIIVPGIFLLLTTLSFNLVGDGLRDALGPSERS